MSYYPGNPVNKFFRVFGFLTTSLFRIARVCVACASPAKFPEALETAGVEIVENDIVRAVMKMPTKHEWMRKGEDWEAILRGKIESITARAKANA